MTSLLENAKTEYVDAAGIRFAYRRIGATSGIPLVLLQHFTGTMDSWDPILVNELARGRPVIVFNNAGVGTSSGTTPDSLAKMSTDAAAFIRAVGLDKADLLGFSLGGFIAQTLAAEMSGLIRKVIIAGSAPRGGEEHLLAVVQEAFSHKDAPDVRLPLFFTPSVASQTAGRAFLKRASARIQDRDPDSGEAVRSAQAKAIIDWCAAADEGHSMLKKIAHPTLIVHGSDDTMFPSPNAYGMFKAMRNAYLILYPDSGHGALFQYARTFVQHAEIFLSEST